MKNIPSWLPPFALVLVALLLGNVKCDGPAAAKEKPDGPDLRRVFRQHDDLAAAEHDARTFAKICRKVADVLEFDGKQEHKHITTANQADAFQLVFRQLVLEGRSFKRTYPELPETIKQYMEAEVGREGGKLTDERRAKWIAAMQKLGECAEWAAENLEQ